MPTRDELLDEALKLTFPASDPIAVEGDVIPMKIVLFGASSIAGQRVAREACARGHHLTVVSRMPFRYERPDPRVVVLGGDPTDAERIATAVRGFTAVVSAIDPGTEGDGRLVVQVANALIAGLARGGVQRLVVVGRAPALDDAAEREALERYRTSDLEWTYVSPASAAEPGVRTGKYHSRTGDEPATPPPARISAEDLAVAVLDELEEPLNVRQRLTVG